MTNDYSPCINICRYTSTKLDKEEIIYCVGCYRSYDEISRWSSYSDSEKKHIKVELEHRKEKYNL
ncbi:MAG: DUF1289 domain-containing protein [Chloroflexi bacterium]|nr:DUF1289 domain-containing protein [Chloroflexota bacterium]